ncbi:NAD-dependent epimerase/dehydratase [Segniliparus rotundus DSM 44985]|uniref:NAD-dependent epimerase/dehydratase n=1 Tax=Segniliparus rotundus (strain ATCC BAA-972 / CDC 1076 / CIP 108378 / DSM 44985 / JCM 13578) TaxID=640132 RepID=D6ZBB7_SEGRD|nr:NAD(P)H-binding protein [Segniliparus rotundus]ADG98869.1 NAD-dependent epimerase/dehydratase [Segniliparus rotundus DSM 44985]
MKVLVTGAGGYVGGRLVPELLSRGHSVRAAFTQPAASERLWWAQRTERVRMDVFDLRQTVEALRGVDCVYYLIHGLGGRDFLAADRAAAKNAARAAAECGVRKVVYLSGLVPDEPEHSLSKHLSSRLETERILSEQSNGFDTITLRAAIILGSASTSFEVLKQICERMPALTIPAWMRSQVQPIAVVDVVQALAGALEAEVGTRHYDIGGREQMSYPQLLSRFCAVSGKPRPQIVVPLAPAKIVSFLASRLVDVPTGTVEALVESLKHDMVCGEDDFVEDLLPPGHQLVETDEAIRRANAPARAEDPADRDPLGPLPHDPQWAQGGKSLAGAALTRASSILENLARPAR